VRRRYSKDLALLVVFKNGYRYSVNSAFKKGILVSGCDATDCNKFRRGDE